MTRAVGVRALCLFAVIGVSCASPPLSAAPRYLRVNQAGYLPADTKVALAFSNDDISGLTFSVVRISDGATVFGPAAMGADCGAYCAFPHNHRLDFTALQAAATYRIRLSDGLTESPPFVISEGVYAGLHGEMLNFLRAQRCGANPLVGATCHAGGASNPDAKCTDDGLVRDISGGWHDAGDYIKFLTTGSNVLDLLLFAYREDPSKFSDEFLADGSAGQNGIPDILDEAKHGLDWVLKLHAAPDKLYYQVGGSQDHDDGWRLPQNDTANYGLGGYRPAYHGIGANIAGRSAAALAMAYLTWKNDLGNAAYAATCLAAARELYTLAQNNLAAQDGMPADYYNETTFYDDLELAAVELYKATGEGNFLNDAITYSSQAGSSWGWFDWGGINALAHYELYPHADAETRLLLKGYLVQDLESNRIQALSNPFRVSTTYGWGSASVMTGTVVMCHLYKELFPADATYDALHDEVRDYLLGRNQWGVSWIVGAGETYTRDPHHQVADILDAEIRGMCIEGPMSLAEWQGMGIVLSDADEYTAFQSDDAVYHDDVADWATNEPTIFQCALTVCAVAPLAKTNAGDFSDPVRISFQPPASSIPTGHLADGGFRYLPFRAYGWR